MGALLMQYRGATTVVLQVTGGLGNQLFQYAAARSVADKVGGRVFLLKPRQSWPSGHPVLQDLFEDVHPPRLKLAVASNRLVTRTLNAVGALNRQVIKRHAFAQRPIFWALSADFDPASAVPPARVIVMHGLFQHPSWWGLSAQSLASQISSNHREAISNFRSDLVIAFRRSDYIGMGVQLPLRYYERALEEVHLERGSKVRLVCEDKPFLISAARALRRRGIAAEPMVSANPLDDLWCIAGGAQAIMANSSFSWWGATIGDQLDPGSIRKVVCPTPWMPTWRYSAAEGQQVDLASPAWSRLNSGFQLPLSVNVGEC